MLVLIGNWHLSRETFRYSRQQPDCLSPHCSPEDGLSTVKTQQSELRNEVKALEAKMNQKKSNNDDALAARYQDGPLALGCVYVCQHHGVVTSQKTLHLTPLRSALFR